MQAPLHQRSLESSVDCSDPNAESAPALSASSLSLYYSPFLVKWEKGRDGATVCPAGSKVILTKSK